jgi:hypothetical protein
LLYSLWSVILWISLGWYFQWRYFFVFIAGVCCKSVNGFLLWLG